MANKDLCVLRVDPQVLNHPEAVVSSKNASRKDAHFKPADSFKFDEKSTDYLNQPESLVSADSMTEREERKSVRQAEVIIPHGIHPSLIRGILVANELTKTHILGLFNGNCPVPIDIHPSLFYTKHTSTPHGTNPLTPIQPQPLANELFPDVKLQLLRSDDDQDVYEVKQEPRIPGTFADDELDDLFNEMDADDAANALFDMIEEGAAGGKLPGSQVSVDSGIGSDKENSPSRSLPMTPPKTLSQNEIPTQAKGPSAS